MHFGFLNEFLPFQCFMKIIVKRFKAQFQYLITPSINCGGKLFFICCTVLPFAKNHKSNWIYPGKKYIGIWHMCPLDMQGRKWVYGSIQHHRKNCRNSIKTCKITYIICLCCKWWGQKSVNVKKLGNQTPWHSTMTMCCRLPLATGMGGRKNDPKFNIVNESSKKKTTATNTQPISVIVLSATTTARRETITTTHKYYILALNLPIPGLLDSRVWESSVRDVNKPKKKKGKTITLWKLHLFNNFIFLTPFSSFACSSLLRLLHHTTECQSHFGNQGMQSNCENWNEQTTKNEIWLMEKRQTPRINGSSTFP